MSVEIAAYRPGLWLTSVALDDFTVRGALIVGDERAIVWDSLSHPQDMRPLHDLADERFFGTVYSHADWDHVWGTAGLPNNGGLIIGHDLCRQRFGQDVAATLQAKQAAHPGRWDAVKLLAPLLTFNCQLSLDLGGITLIMQTLPGHTSDCIVGLIPEWGILLAGDTVETPLPVVNQTSPLEPWIAALQGWQQDPRVETVIPAHGTIGGREIISHTIHYLQQLSDNQPWEPQPDWEPFYQQTHRRNQYYVRHEQSQGLA